MRSDDDRIVRLFLGSALFWLVIGTTVGEYLGMKFIAPDMDSIPWLSFGRLRPVHTNAVFWGWASLGMMGLGHYVLPRVSGVRLQGKGLLKAALVLINVAVLSGSVALMSGINNGGGEYREYVWLIAVLFGAGVALSFISSWMTVARRTIGTIHISSWYIVSAHIFVLVISIVAYLPYGQNGIGETIIQGYYMHQGVGMWFMMCTLGLFYYFIPDELETHIFSHRLGMVAFWSQILFYTVIGTHHFIFSSIPWWLQITAILGSVGMVLPVVAGTVNFASCFRGRGRDAIRSATLPFFMIAVFFYITGSLQGTAEAFQTTNLLWHFTDFSVAHSHMTMYGIITFALFGGIYAVLRRTSDGALPTSTIRLQFILAIVGLLLYTIPLMIGGTLRGQSWIDGKPFIDSVILMADYWLWRAIGGTLMWTSHLVAIVNFIRMR